MPPWPVGVPKNMTPEERIERSRKAALTRTTADYYIESLTQKRLTPAQRERLANLLGAYPDGGAA